MDYLLTRAEARQLLTDYLSALCQIEGQWGSPSTTLAVVAEQQAPGWWTAIYQHFGFTIEELSNQC